jgi:enamine deaminase RidA (YjgF/YER057c/UK114 family)
MTPSQRLAELGITLPEPPKPVGSYVAGLRTGNLVLVSGQIPIESGVVTVTGKVGADVTIDEASAAARMCALNALSIAADTVGGLEHIARIVRLAVYVNSAPGFTDQPKVANGASDLMVEIFGDAGRHVRAAVGNNELPLNAAVEVELMAEAQGAAA